MNKYLAYFTNKKNNKIENSNMILIIKKPPYLFQLFNFSS